MTKNTKKREWSQQETECTEIQGEWNGFDCVKVEWNLTGIGDGRMDAVIIAGRQRETLCTANS